MFTWVGEGLVYLACIQDGHVASAAAEIAVQPLHHCGRGGGLSCLLASGQCGMACHHKAWRAEATLGSMMSCKLLCIGITNVVNILRSLWTHEGDLMGLCQDLKGSHLARC